MALHAVRWEYLQRLRLTVARNQLDDDDVPLSLVYLFRGNKRLGTFHVYQIHSPPDDVCWILFLGDPCSNSSMRAMSFLSIMISSAQC